MVTTAAAAKETAPVALSERADQASEVGFPIVNATANPIDVEPAAAPDAVVTADAVVDADAASEPTELDGPAASVADERTFTIATATAGTIDTPGPDAPARASVVSACVFDADKVTTPPASEAPVPTLASAESSTRFSATEAPIPTEEPPTAVFGNAFATDEAFDKAVSETAPLTDVEEPDFSSASVLMLTMFKANEPAIDAEPAAPEVASLEKVAPACVSAATSSEVAEKRPPSSDASFVRFASVIATPAPIAAEPPVALPSAFDFAAAVCDE